MIPLRDQEMIRARFAAELAGPVKIELFGRRPSPVFIPGQEECPQCPDLETILTEVARLAPQIDLRVHERGAEKALEQRFGIERIPATVIRGVVNRPLLFYGLPVMLLFPLLIEVIVWASEPTPGLIPAVKRKLKRLKQDVRVQVFVTPDAPFCAEAASIVLALGLGSAHIRAEVVAANEFPALAERMGITGVPVTVINGRDYLPGITEPEALAAAIVRNAEQPVIAARPGLLLGVTPMDASTTPLARPEPPAEGGVVRPSGLIIPGR